MREISFVLAALLVRRLVCPPLTGLIPGLLLAYGCEALLVQGVLQIISHVEDSIQLRPAYGAVPTISVPVACLCIRASHVLPNITCGLGIVVPGDDAI